MRDLAKALVVGGAFLAGLFVGGLRNRPNPALVRATDSLAAAVRVSDSIFVAHRSGDSVSAQRIGVLEARRTVLGHRTDTLYVAATERLAQFEPSAAVDSLTLLVAELKAACDKGATIADSLARIAEVRIAWRDTTINALVVQRDSAMALLRASLRAPRGRRIAFGAGIGIDQGGQPTAFLGAIIRLW